MVAPTSVFTAKQEHLCQNQTGSNYPDHFTTGRLLKFTASPIIMMIFTSIYTIVDGFFVLELCG